MKDPLNRTERSWVMYDVANSAFVLTVTTTLMPIFFKGFASAGTDGSGSTSAWAITVGIASLALALLSPILGTIADYKGYKKRLFLFFYILGVASTLSFFFIGKGMWLLTTILYVVSWISFSGANLFYDSFITDVTDDRRMDRVSSSGFGWGYIGSVVPFVLGIVVIFLLGKDDPSMPVSVLGTKIAFVITAIWWALFTIPMIRNVRQKYGMEPEKGAVLKSFKRLFETLKDIRAHKQAFYFLLAYFFYIDGVDTIISMATAYGTDLGFSAIMLILLVLLIQVIAFPCAILFGRLALRFGTRRMIRVGILIYVAITFIAFLLPFLSSQGLKVGLFWFVAFLVAFAQGGIQALSRSFFGRIVPKDRSAAYFGFYNIFGKFATILGPFLLAFFTQVSGDSRYGVLSLVLLFVAGAILLGIVKEEKAQP